MSFQHNYMAHEVSAELLRQVRTDRAEWSHPRLSRTTTLWQGIAEWPRPDIAFEDRSTNASLALEFKPPNQPKREYVTGLGQALTYLKEFEFSGLVVPERAADGAEIAEYLRSLLANTLEAVPLALLAYGEKASDLRVLRPLSDRGTAPRLIPAGIGRDVFWGYWRDLSNHDLLSLLILADTSRPRSFEWVFGRYWRRFATTGRARTWEGRFRKRKSAKAAGYSGERLNSLLAMRHAGLLTADARLTADGHELLRIGKIYGADSVAFLEALAQRVLTIGQHLELIFWVAEKQRMMPVRAKRRAESYYLAIDRLLAKEGIIAPPRRDAAKAHFFRDEPKLWNKLGLLDRGVSGQYFHPGYGLAFNWRKIVSVLESGG